MQNKMATERTHAAATMMDATAISHSWKWYDDESDRGGVSGARTLSKNPPCKETRRGEEVGWNDRYGSSLDTRNEATVVVDVEWMLGETNPSFSSVDSFDTSRRRPPVHDHRRKEVSK